MGISTYDAKKVSVIFAGVPITGFVEDSFVEASREDDTWVTSTGADGKVARARKNNKQGKVVLSLMQTSNGNDVLAAAAEADELAGLGVYPLLIKDNLGRTVVASKDAFVLKPADAVFGTELSDRKWTIQCAKYESFVGGTEIL